MPKRIWKLWRCQMPKKHTPTSSTVCNSEIATFICTLIHKLKPYLLQNIANWSWDVWEPSEHIEIISHFQFFCSQNNQKHMQIESNRYILETSQHSWQTKQDFSSDNWCFDPRSVSSISSAGGFAQSIFGCSTTLTAFTNLTNGCYPLKTYSWNKIKRNFMDNMGEHKKWIGVRSQPWLTQNTTLKHCYTKFGKSLVGKSNLQTPVTNDLYRSSTFATLSTIFLKTYDPSKLSSSIGHKPAFRITIISNPFHNVAIETTSLTFCLLCFFDLIIELSCFILLSKSQDLLGFAAVFQ